MSTASPTTPAASETERGAAPAVDVPRTGGATPEEAPTVSQTDTLEGALSPGQSVWYRFEPALSHPNPGGSTAFTITILARQLMEGAYAERARGTVAYVDPSGAEVGGLNWDTANTLSDADFQNNAGPSHLTGATMVRITYAEGGEGLPDVHYKLSITPW